MKYRQWGKADVNSISNTEIIDRMLDSGAWHFLKQRPYDVAANPKDEPKAIFISGFDSAPLAPDYNFIMAGKQFDFQNGIKILSKLTKGKFICLYPQIINHVIHLIMQKVWKCIGSPVLIRQEMWAFKYII